MQDTQRRSSTSVRIHYPKFNRAEVIERLRQSIRELKLSMPLKEAYLFGSYAKGNHTASSDIDVLIVVEGEDPDAYKKVYKKIRMPRLELLMYTTNEYMEMRKKHPKTIKKLLENKIKLI